MSEKALHPGIAGLRRGSDAGGLIVVIDDSPARAQKLQELIEFMDAPEVQIASPADWQQQLRERRLAAVFLGVGIRQRERQQLIQSIGELDRNVPIVLLSGEASDD